MTEHPSGLEPQDRIDIEELMDSPAFRRWCARLVQRCGLTDVRFHESHAMASFLAGRASVAAELIAEAQSVAPGAYVRAFSALTREQMEILAARQAEQAKQEAEED